MQWTKYILSKMLLAFRFPYDESLKAIKYRSIYLSINLINLFICIFGFQFENVFETECSTCSCMESISMPILNAFNNSTTPMQIWSKKMFVFCCCEKRQWNVSHVPTYFGHNSLTNGASKTEISISLEKNSKIKNSLFLQSRKTWTTWIDWYIYFEMNTAK